MATRSQLDAGYVLHSYPWRETSLVVEAFLQRHGRVGLLARGARRPRSAMRGQLLSFQPVEIGWVKGSELGQLRSVDWAGRFRPLAGLRLMCGFYLNELLLRLLPRDDPHERLFTDYGIALDRLADSGEDPSTVLRRFERRLLAELGYDPPFEREAANGTAIEPDARYRYDPERGPLRSAAGQGSIAGQTLIDMAADDYRSERTRAEAKELMRELIAHRCGSQKLHSREILKELLDL